MSVTNNELGQIRSMLVNLKTVLDLDIDTVLSSISQLTPNDISKLHSSLSRLLYVISGVWVVAKMLDQTEDKGSKVEEKSD